MTKIIGIMGYMGSGKTTVAQILVEKYGYRRERFAGPLKDMLKAIGLEDYDLDGPGKTIPNPILSGATPRHAMQTLGTEWGRVQINTLFWVNLWSSRVKDHPLIVTDDLRFPNEANAIHKLGGQIWRVFRPHYQGMNHESEAYVEHIKHDFSITNNGTIEDLSVLVGALIS